jgi:hypothetical protein
MDRMAGCGWLRRERFFTFVQNDKLGAAAAIFPMRNRRPGLTLRPSVLIHERAEKPSTTTDRCERAAMPFDPTSV